MARKNTPAQYTCSVCSTLGHNKRTCPSLGLAPKAKPVKKPRVKKVEAAETEVVATIPVATEEQMNDLRALVAEIEAETEDEAEALALLAEIEALAG